jgi:NhaP-type Na+/H+ or K+/H+ antiporter
MGMGVFTGGFEQFDLVFCVVALLACLVGRALNIFPLSWLANLCRTKRSNKISGKMQVVLWFAGLRGAIAFALSENMPGPHKDVYATATLTICIVTTVFCGGFTERMLTTFAMKEEPTPLLNIGNEDDNLNLGSLTYKPPAPAVRRESGILYERRMQIREGIKGAWNQFDDRFLKPHFGGDHQVSNGPRLERQSNKDRDSEHLNSDHNSDNEDLDEFHNWSSNSKPLNGDYEMKTLNNNRNDSPHGSTAQKKKRKEEQDEEMFSLTSRQDSR